MIYYKKDSGKSRIPYNDAVEEALCYGWIDSTLKGIDDEKFAQRFTPRKGTGNWSETNRERMRRLIKLGKMTPAGLAKANGIAGSAGKRLDRDRLVIPPDILKALKRDKNVWKNFQKFTSTYKRIRIWWIAAARHRPEIFNQRLRYFLKMTGQNKRFGMVQ